MEARQDQLHFNLFSKDKGRSDKDSTERGEMELNKPVSLVMFTADKNQSLKPLPSLFTTKELHQHFSKSLNSSCPDANWWDCIPSSGSWTLQSWTVPSDTSFLTFFSPLITKQTMSVEFCSSYFQFILTISCLMFLYFDSFFCPGLGFIHMF